MTNEDFTNKFLIGGLYFIIWRNVASFCDANELFQLGFVSSSLQEVCDYPDFWKNILSNGKYKLTCGTNLEPHLHIDYRFTNFFFRHSYYFIECIVIRELKADVLGVPDAEFDTRDDHDLLKMNFLRHHIPIPSSFTQRLVLQTSDNQLKEKLCAPALITARRIKTVVAQDAEIRTAEREASTGLDSAPFFGVCSFTPIFLLLSAAGTFNLLIFLLGVKIFGPPGLLTTSIFDHHQGNPSSFRGVTDLSELYWTPEMLVYNVYEKHPAIAARLAEINLSEPHPNSEKICLALILMLIPHFLLIKFSGGGYFGIFYSNKRMTWSRKLFAATVLVIPRHVLSYGIWLMVELWLWQTIIIGWLIPFPVYVASFVLFCSALYFLRSTTGKSFFKTVLTPFFELLLPVFLPKLSPEVYSHVIETISKVLVLGFLSKTIVRVAILVLGVIFIILYQLFDWTSIIERIGVSLFAIDAASLYMFHNNNIVVLTENSSKRQNEHIFLLLASFHTICLFTLRWLVALIFWWREDPRISSLFPETSPVVESKKTKRRKPTSNLPRHILVIICAFFTIRYQWVMAFSPEIKNETLLSRWWIFAITKFLIASLGSDFYRCYILRDEFDHELFYNSKWFAKDREAFLPGGAKYGRTSKYIERLMEF